ncbi:MAG: hypothetical protein PHG66_03220 [Candidatus Colwellbacteria bacterium]|nr:hypothetical protein [Candidatus Colwellbacteria bacterium]
MFLKFLSPVYGKKHIIDAFYSFMRDNPGDFSSSDRSSTIHALGFLVAFCYTIIFSGFVILAISILMAGQKGVWMWICSGSGIVFIGYLFLIVAYWMFGRLGKNAKQ